MNDQRPYDPSLRDKLNRLPVPDMHKSWQEMRILLDEEMPEGGGARRRRGWWLFSAILVFMIVGSWTLITLNFSKQNADPPLTATQNSSPPDGYKSGADNAGTGTSRLSEKPGAADDKILLSKELISDKTNSADQKQFRSGDHQHKDIVIGRDQSVKTNDKLSYNKLSESKVADTKVADHKSSHYMVSDDKVSGNKISDYKARNNRASSDKLSDRKLVASPAVVSAGPAKSGTLQNNRLTPGTRPHASVQPLPKSQSLASTSGLTEQNRDADNPESAKAGNVQPITVGSFAATIDSVQADLSNVQYAHVSKKYYRQHKKYGKPVNIREPYTTVGRNFAIGLSLPLAFPLGDQKAFGYNVNGGVNTATDYIPAPHVQYHFNSKSYIQSELQVMSPQFIRPVLLFQNYYSNNMYHTTSSVYARKLYYFNVPVSVHYSPFKHFYMGTGLQFSSLLSGVAMHEQLRTGMVSSDSIYSVQYTRFSGDSISNKLNGSEMRLMVDANYYWNRFTVGLRYNQALSNYVSTRAAPSMAYTFDKNKALQFYLRYNLWEDKKRNAPGSQLAKRH